MKVLKNGLLAQLVFLFSLLFMLNSAQADYGSNSYQNTNSPIRVEVLDDSGRVLNQYSNNRKSAYKTQRAYLEAVKGKRYKLRIKNTSNRRVGVVLAVDGRNILSGKKSHLRKNEKMYVLDPYETASYKGWRTAKNQVNRFYFTTAGDSYSNAWGDRSAMGVIAVAVFDEKQRHYYKKHRKQQRNRMAPNRGYLAEESTGTGFGEEEYSPSIRVRFKAKANPAFKHFYKYEWRNTLCKRGIVSCDSYEDDREYNRFWPRQSNSDYVPYPPNYAHKKKRDWSDQFTRSWEYDYKRGW